MYNEKCCKAVIVVNHLNLEIHTTDSGVRLDKQLPSFFPQQHRLTKTQKVVSAAVADSGVVVIQSSASLHIRCRFTDLQRRIRLITKELGRVTTITIRAIKLLCYLQCILCSHTWVTGKAQPYLQFTKEPVDGVLAHSMDLAAVQRNASIRLAVCSCHFLEAHQPLSSLQQNTQDHKTSLHVSLKQRHKYCSYETLYNCPDTDVNTKTDTL